MDAQVIAIAKSIVKALETTTNLTKDLVRLLRDFEVCLARKSEILEKKSRVSEIEEQLDSVLVKVENWDCDRSMTWNRGPNKHLEAINEIQCLTESLESLSLKEYGEKDDDQKKDEHLQFTRSILQMVMSWLEEEFGKILVENRQPLELEGMPVCWSEDGLSFVISTSSGGDDSSEDTQARLQGDNSNGSEDFTVDLIYPVVIADLKCITEVMFTSNYDQECCQAYISNRKDALEDILFLLEVERPSIEEVLQMEWSFLDSKIKKWIRGMKIFVRVYLASEKRLSEKIFGAFGSVSQSCFIDSSKGLMLQLLSFSQAIAIRPHSPENIFCLQNMYDGLADLLPDIDALFSEEAGSSVRTESHQVLSRLGDSVRTFLELRNDVRRNESTTPLAGGGVHHLTSKSLGAVHEDEQVIAIAQQTVKSLGTSKNPTDDMIRFLSDLQLRLSTSSTSEILGKKKGISEIEEWINSVEEKVMNWCSDRSMIWDRGPEESREYLWTVVEIGQLIKSLGRSSLNEVQERDDLLQRAHNVLQMTMSRLEEEFRHILLENKQALEPEHLSFFDSTSSVDDNSIEDMRVRLQRDNSKGSEEFIIDLIRPNVIPDLKCIAEVMFVSNYDAECCQAYISIRKDALEECLLVLEVEKLSIEEVLQMEWSLLHSKIKEWIRVMKIFVRVYLAREKSLSEQIFGAFGSVSRSCFIDSSKGLMLQLLSFGQAIAIRPHSPEKFFRLLNMYDGLADLLPDIDALFSEEAGSSVRTESHEVLSRLGKIELDIGPDWA